MLRRRAPPDHGLLVAPAGERQDPLFARQAFVANMCPEKVYLTAEQLAPIIRDVLAGLVAA